MMNNNPLILISNDDSINAPGVHFLAEIAQQFGEVYVVAPKTPQSGKSSAMSVNSPLRINRLEFYDYGDNVKFFDVSGTPVDCVKLAIDTILPRRPDLMLCGVNHGSNAGNNLIYSGTMGAVMEACMLGIPAIGYSLTDHSLKTDFSYTVPFIEKITRAVITEGLPSGICLNVNFPDNCEIKGLKVVRSAASHWTEEYCEYIDPHGRPFYWLTGAQVNEEPDATDTDLYWLEQQYATIVPVKPDQTNIEAINHLAAVFK